MNTTPQSNPTDTEGLVVRGAFGAARKVDLKDNRTQVQPHELYLAKTGQWFMFLGYGITGLQLLIYLVSTYPILLLFTVGGFFIAKSSTAGKLDKPTIQALAVGALSILVIVGKSQVPKVQEVYHNNVAQPVSQLIR